MNITTNHYKTLERDLRRVSEQLNGIIKPELSESLKTCEYLLGVLRAYSKNFELVDGDEDRDEMLQSLFTALYR